MIFTTWQRVMSAAIVGSVQGNVATLRKADRLLDILEFSKEEKERIGLKISGPTYTWVDTDTEWDLDIPYECMDIFRNAIMGYGEWPAANRQEVFSLHQTLGIQ